MAKKIIQIITKGDKIFDEIVKEIELDEKVLKEEIQATGDLLFEDIKTIIQSSKVRPQAGEPTDLENSITLDKFENGFGLGDIETMNTNAPYWPALNYGSAHMVGKHMPGGFFSPGPPEPNREYFRQGRWFKTSSQTGGEGKGPIVQRPIIGIFFIERTVNVLISLIDQIKLRGS